MTREQEINNEFKYAARKEKPEMKIEKYYPPDDDRYTKAWWKFIGWTALCTLVFAIFAVWFFYAVIYGENIDNTLSH